MLVDFGGTGKDTARVGEAAAPLRSAAHTHRELTCVCVEKNSNAPSPDKSWLPYLLRVPVAALINAGSMYS